MTPSQKNEKALAALKNLDTYHGYDWSEYGDQREREIIRQAREAIAALSQPTTGDRLCPECKGKQYSPGLVSLGEGIRGVRVCANLFHLCLPLRA